jgi:hypothetical protein
MGAICARTGGNSYGHTPERAANKGKAHGGPPQHAKTARVGDPRASHKMQNLIYDGLKKKVSPFHFFQRAGEQQAPRVFTVVKRRH